MRAVCTAYLFITLAVSIFTSPSLFAASLTVASVTGSSATEVSANGTTTIWGGLGGDDCSMTADGKTTCNSCSSRVTSCPQSQPLCACNTNRIYNSLVLRINLKKSAKTLGNAIVMLNSGTGTSTLLPITGQNNGDFVDFTWSTLCGSLGSADCNTLINFGSSLTLNIGIDQNGNGLLEASELATSAVVRLLNPGLDYSVYGAPKYEGFGDFNVYPGGGRAMIENVLVPSTFPTLSYGTTVRAMRVFVGKNSMLEANYDSAVTTMDLKLDDKGQNFKNNVISGLNDPTLYFFRVAAVDQAGNVSQFLPSNQSLGPECTTAPTAQCRYATTTLFPIPRP